MLLSILFEIIIRILKLLFQLQRALYTATIADNRMHFNYKVKY